MVMHTYVPSVPAPLAGPYQVAPASDQPPSMGSTDAQGRKARAMMAMKQDKTTTRPICLEAMPEAGLHERASLARAVGYMYPMI